MLEAQIHKRRRDFDIDVELILESGKSLALFGGSGAGKSTVLSCIAGTEEPDSGFIRLGERRMYPPSLPLHERDLGYMTQEPSLFPHLSIAENVAYGVNVDTDAAWIDELCERLSLTTLLDAPATAVSGGQARRAALARMLARRPKLVLLDEPFAGLDRAVVRGLLDDLKAWKERLGFAMIVVDHRAEVLEHLSPDVVAIEEGKVVQSGTWEQLRKAPNTGLLRKLLLPLLD